MRSRFLGLASLGLALLLPSMSRASSFDAQTGAVRLDADLPFSLSFDTPDAVTKHPLQIFKVESQQGYVRFESQNGALDASAFEHGAAALEGTSSLRIRGDQALLLGNAESFASFTNGRIEIRMWARAEGAMPELRAV